MFINLWHQNHPVDAVPHNGTGDDKFKDTHNTTNYEVLVILALILNVRKYVYRVGLVTARTSGCV